MPPTQWWGVLGVAPSATLEQIGEAWKALVKEHHPDQGGDPERFNQIMAAYNQAKAEKR
jgi:curved DNA-binding protein CbpA